MVTHQYGQLESPKLEKVLFTTSKNIFHSKYVTSWINRNPMDRASRQKQKYAFLIGVVYQPISNETERLVFLKGLNIFLVRFIQNGMVL